MKSKQKILIVDDEQRNQRILTETLEDLFELYVASSGEEALKILEQESVDLVLLDIMMPGIDGYEVCRRIRANPNLEFSKVILVSGKAMIDERLKGYEVGADDYMTKPFVPEELLAKTKVFLRLTQVERELSVHNKSLGASVTEKTEQLLVAESKLFNSAKMSALGEMAGGMAHEINTPLATIALLCEQQMEIFEEGEELDPDGLKKTLNVINTATKQISKIIHGLQTFSRNSSSDPFTKESLAKILSDTELLCSERFKKSDVSLEIDPTLLSIECRPTQVAQILLNLFNNAFYAVKNQPEKWIRVSVKEENDYVDISVVDSGKSIPAVVRQKMFQPFFTTKDIGEGTGLGLSISKGLAEIHQGTLFLDDQISPTRFVFRLPKIQNKNSAVA